MLTALSVFHPIGMYHRLRRRAELTTSTGVIITSLVSWALVPKFSCKVTLPACSSLQHAISVSASTCCTRAANAGWRYALYTLGGLSVVTFFVRFFVFNFSESPKFLINKGRDAEACEVVRCIARANKRESTISNAELEEIDARFAAAARPASRLSKGAREGEDSVSEKPEGKEKRVKVPAMGGHLKLLFSSGYMVRLTLLTWVCYAADYWCVRVMAVSVRLLTRVVHRGFVIAGNFLPKFLAERGAAEHQSTAEVYRN